MKVVYLQTMAQPHIRVCRSETSVKHDYKLRSKKSISLKDERPVYGVLMQPLQVRFMLVFK